MGKKKFIDKKKSATFHLMARDTSDPNYSPDPSGDRVFVRVDNNYYNSNSIFSDAVEEEENEEEEYENEFDYNGCSELPDKLRKEIIELGFPDDGYNYLEHLREITNTGGGSNYYANPKATFHILPRDVKAYDASRIEVPKIDVVEDEKLISNVASKTVAVKLQRVVDPEVAALLDDSDCSDDEEDSELEEDFVTKANLYEGPLDEDFEKNLNIGSSSRTGLGNGVSYASDVPKKETCLPDLETEVPRHRRPLDEQFDMLELQEYNDSEEEYNNDYMADEYEHRDYVAEKLNHAFKNHPADNLHHQLVPDDIISPEAAPEVIERCKEYGEKYANEDDDDKEVVFVEDSSDESEKWDCETIVTTYSTLDNHPCKIGTPDNRRSRKLVESVKGVSAATSGFIALKGKERLPVDFLPRSKKHLEEKANDEKDKQTEFLKKKPRSEESKEEKKERKSAVKSERREARQLKKEMRGLYKFESQRAQKVAAFTGPSSIHLM